MRTQQVINYLKHFDVRAIIALENANHGLIIWMINSFLVGNHDQPLQGHAGTTIGPMDHPNHVCVCACASLRTPMQYFMLPRAASCRQSVASFIEARPGNAKYHTLVIQVFSYVINEPA